VKVLFDWKDLPLPIEVIGILKNSTTVWGHNALMLNINNKEILVDATWDPALMRSKFPVTVNWDGKSSTLGITRGKTTVMTPEEYDEQKKKMIFVPEEVREFAVALNSFLMSVRSPGE